MAQIAEGCRTFAVQPSEAALAVVPVLRIFVSKIPDARCLPDKKRKSRCRPKHRDSLKRVSRRNKRSIPLPAKRQGIACGIVSTAVRCRAICVWHEALPPCSLFLFATWHFAAMPPSSVRVVLSSLSFYCRFNGCFSFHRKGISKDLTTQLASLSKMNQYSER